MANITKFYVSATVKSMLGNYDVDKVINAVQSELNAGKNLKASEDSRAAFKTVKNEGNERQVLHVTTKSREKIQLENTVVSRFYGWTLTVDDLQLFATTTVSIPDCFTKWLEFAKK